MEKENLILVIDALVSANIQEFFDGRKSTYTSLGYTVNEKTNTFNIDFYVFLYDDSEEPQIVDKLIINKEDKFDNVVMKICGYLNSFNDYVGYENEEEYNFHEKN
jgi:hypothetical protein